MASLWIVAGLCAYVVVLIVLAKVTAFNALDWED